MRSTEKVNGRPFYTSDAYGGNYGIWWVKDLSEPYYQWVIGHSSNKGRNDPLAANLQDVDCPQSLKHFSWWMYIDSKEHWRVVGYNLGIRCLADDDLKEHQMNLDVLKLDGNEPTSYDQSPARTKISKIVTLISKP